MTINLKLEKEIHIFEYFYKIYVIYLFDSFVCLLFRYEFRVPEDNIWRDTDQTVSFKCTDRTKL